MILLTENGLLTSHQHRTALSSTRIPFMQTNTCDPRVTVGSVLQPSQAVLQPHVHHFCSSMGSCERGVLGVGLPKLANRKLQLASFLKHLHLKRFGLSKQFLSVQSIPLAMNCMQPVRWHAAGSLALAEFRPTPTLVVHPAAPVVSLRRCKIERLKRFESLWVSTGHGKIVEKAVRGQWLLRNMRDVAYCGA